MWTQQPRMQHEIITLGETTKTPAEFRSFLDSIRARFTPETYNLITHNCNNFTDECCQFLIGQGIPGHITGLPAELMATPIGMMLRPMIEGFENNMRQQGGGGMDPFGGAGGLGGLGGDGFPPANPASVSGNPWTSNPNPWAGNTASVPAPGQGVAVEKGSTCVIETAKLEPPVTRVGESHPHARLSLETLKSRGGKLLSLDKEGGGLVGKMVAAGTKVGQALSESDTAMLKKAFQARIQGDTSTTTGACRIVSRCFREWPEKALLSVVWLVRWLATQPEGNAYLASEETTVQALVDRLPKLPDAPRMLGLNACANLFAHPPGARTLSETRHNPSHSSSS